MLTFLLVYFTTIKELVQFRKESIDTVCGLCFHENLLLVGSSLPEQPAFVGFYHMVSLGKNTSCICRTSGIVALGYGFAML